jgi:DNA helicase HerA-like ATPase
MKLSQKARLVILVLYGGLLFSVCRFLFGTWLPPSAEKGLWLYASLAHLLLGTLLLSPYFTKPADAVSDAVIAALILPEIHGAVLSLNERWASWAWKSVFAYYFVVIVLGAVAMLLRGNRTIWGKQIAQSAYILSTHLGETALVFSLLFLFALLAFHLESMREFITLMTTWVIIVPFHLFEHVAMLGNDLQEVWSESLSYENMGETCARKEPNVILLRRTAEGTVRFGQVLTMKGSAQDTLHHAMIIDEFQLAEERWIRCVEIAGQFTPEIEKQLIRTASISPVFKLDAIADRSSIDTAFQVSRVYSSRADMIGLVAPNTDITTLRFELTRTDLEIGEGQLVEVTIGNKQVLYQIINGLTQEEILAQKNTYGFARGSAKKIGAWDKNGKRFEHVRWIPRLNEPVFLQQASVSGDDATAIGFFPDTNFPVEVEVQQLVTHNAAILGILGAGKTFLALELVERMLLGGIKVIVLDLTNQYADQLSPYYDANAEQPNIDKLKATGPPGKINCKLNVAEGGSVQAFQAELKKQLTAFMADAGARIRIYNPVAFEIWRQDSKPFNNQASMAQLTPTEITRIITEVGLELCSGTISDQAKLCIVYEEAHSLIPEWNAVASEGDKAATNGTAKAILQGRKYGLGCLVITQRTANVTKTILNQCNSVFALRVFDSTGMEFLRNYVGDDYSSVLSTLENRHAVVFGRASSCSDPVLVRLNDRDKFLSLNRPQPEAPNQ